MVGSLKYPGSNLNGKLEFLFLKEGITQQCVYKIVAAHQAFNFKSLFYFCV